MKKPKNDLATLMNASLETANQNIKNISKNHRLQTSLQKKSPAQPKIHKPEVITRRSTIAFHCSDLVRIDTVLDFLRDGTAQRGTLSDGIKIALALCPLDKKKLQRHFLKYRNRTGGEKLRFPYAVLDYLILMNEYHDGTSHHVMWDDVMF